MNDEELRKIWTALDTRVSTINDRTKAHTIQIQEIQKTIHNIIEKGVKSKNG